MYFARDHQPFCFACDRWDTVADNVQAIRKTIEALRGIERWGSGGMVEQVFQGFIALPSDSPWTILGVSPGADRKEIEAAWRNKARHLHPDRGGSHEAMTRLNEARQTALAASASQRQTQMDVGEPT